MKGENQVTIWISPLNWIKKLYHHLITEHCEAWKLGVAVGLGILVGTTPFYGFHLWICIFLALIFRLNKLTLYLAANISNPIIAPFLIFSSVQLGNYLLFYKWLGFNYEDFKRFPIEYIVDHFFIPWLVGGLIIGIVLGISGGTLVYLILRMREKDPTYEQVKVENHGIEDRKLKEIVRNIERSYLKYGRFHYYYLKSKLKLDPVYFKVLKYVPERGVVVDLGCGRGVLAIMLKILKPNLKVIAVDWDKEKVELGKRVAKDLGLKEVDFLEMDVINYKANCKVDLILMIDLLHYFPYELQTKMLNCWLDCLAEGGKIIIREFELKKGVRSKLTYWGEKIFTSLKFNKGLGVFPIKIQEIEEVVKSKGLYITIEPCYGKSPFSNLLLLIHGEDTNN